MRRKFIQIILGISLVLLAGKSLEANDFPKFIQKKIDKAVQKAFSEEDVALELLHLSFESDDQLKNIKLNVLKSKENAIGFAAFASSKGKNDFFDYMVLLDTELTIRKVVVLVYRSSYGGEIMAKSWLRQFEGKSNGEEMEFEKDIDSISGATISAPSIVNGVKRLSILLRDLQQKGEL